MANDLCAFHLNSKLVCGRERDFSAHSPCQHCGIQYGEPGPATKYVPSECVTQKIHGVPCHPFTQSAGTKAMDGIKDALFTPWSDDYGLRPMVSDGPMPEMTAAESAEEVAATLCEVAYVHIMESESGALFSDLDILRAAAAVIKMQIPQGENWQVYASAIRFLRELAERIERGEEGETQ